jgi:protein SCO1/2
MSTIGRALGLVMSLALPLTLTACHGSERNAAPRASSPAVGDADHTNSRSIYGLDLPLTDQDGHALVLSDLRGRVLVAAMMYSNCKSVCPRVTEDMKGIERQLAHRDRDRVEFVLFSLDPGRDTPAALRGFAREHGLDPSRWRLLAASQDGVRDLAAVLGVKYKSESGGEIAHSAMIFVIDRDGVVRHRQVGLNQDPRELIAALDEASH